MSATDLYHDLPKLARVQLPSGTSYALIDYNGRELIAPIFSDEVAYSSGNLVVYEDNLYRFITSHSAGVWNSNHVTITSVEEELDRLWSAITGGVHYIGTTTTPIYDGATTNPITINGSPVTAQAGDLVILDLSASGVSTTIPYNGYPVAVTENHYYQCLLAGATAYYFCTSSQTIQSVEDVSDIGDLIYLSNNKGSYRLEFIWSGSRWDAFGSATDFGDLAFKDKASGSYTKPTGTGSVTVAEYSASSSKLVTKEILEVGGTTQVSKVTLGSALNIASAGTAVRYGTADVAASAKTVATKSSTSHVYGTADVGSSIGVGTALSGTTVFNTDAIKSATLGGTTTFNTNAIKSASLTSSSGTMVAAQNGITASASEDCLILGSATLTNLGISTEPASTATVTISTSPAATAQVSLSTTNITPATSAPSSQVFYEMGTTSIYEAVAAPNDQTITPAVANGTITPVTSVSDITVATAAAAATTVAAGTLDANGSGGSVIITVASSSATKTVTVGTESGTVTVK